MAAIRLLLIRFSLLLAAFAGLAPAAAEPAQGRTEQGPRPAIWLIEDADTRIYLFGTVHVFPASLRWRSPALERVIAEADELVMETPDASSEDMSAGDRMIRPMQLGKSVPILSRVSPAARPALQAAIDATGMPTSVYDELSTWGVAFLLSGFQLNNVPGPDGAMVPMSGAEEVLAQIFRKSRRPIGGVETVEDQLRVFSTMPLSAQRMFLESTVLGAAVGEPAPDGEATAAGGDMDWVRGDVDSIAADMLTMPPVIYDRLLTRRNRNWTEWLRRRMDRPGTVLFAVGAGHLAGPDSVQAMLAEHGVVARRID
jgi:uncharacterized protein